MAESRVLQLKRPVLLVSCPKQAMTVYGGLLGFQENYRLEHETRTFSHEAFRLPQDLETTFITLDLGDAERVLALIAVGDAAIDWDQPRAGIVLEVTSVAATLREADVRGLACLPIKREPNPEQGPPRSEAGFYDPDGNPIVVYDLSP